MQQYTDTETYNQMHDQDRQITQRNYNEDNVSVII